MKKLLSDLSLLLDRRSRVRAVGLFFMMLVGAALEGLGIGAIMPFLVLVTAAGDPGSVPPAIAKVFEGRDPGSVVLLAAGLLFGLYTVKNLFLFLTDYAQFRFVFRRQVEVATRLFDAYMRRPYEAHMQKPTAELLRNIDHEVGLVFTNVFMPTLTVMIEALTALAIGITLFYLDPEKTLWIIGALFIISFAYYLPVTKGTSRLGKSQQFHQGEMIKWVNDGIYAFKEIRVGRKQDFFVEGFRESGEQFAQAKRFHRTVKAIPIRLIELIGVGAILLVVAATILRGGDPAAILPAMGVLAAAAVRLMPSVNRILSSITAIRHFYPALEVVADEFRAIQEPPRLSTSETLQSAPWDALRFDDVSYRYPGGTKDAVSNVTFEIRSGESVALVGRSGSGKTTIADLLLGLLTPTAGRIAFDDASSSGTYADRLVMGYVPQPSYLLDESVRHNVAFGVEDAEIDDQRVSDSLASVQMKEVVQAMDGQLDSRMGRDGVRMSGGQRQRLGIARALYDDPEILILDEATSALDNETERDVSEAIMALAGQRTLLIVAHRLNTVRRCDKVLFFESGQLVADGDYDTLSVQCGPFRRLIEAGEI